MSTSAGAKPEALQGRAGAEPPYPRPAYAWYVVALLILAYVVAFIDRGILALLIEPIKADLGLSDTQISWLMGPAFGIFYVTLGIPVGILADRYSRRNIIVAGVALWSAATAACGLARDFVQLFLARVMVGVGEATLSPSALSMISDYFPRRQAVGAVGLFNMGQSVGAGLAFLLGGQVILWVTGSSGTEWPIVGRLEPWQMTFVIVGLPGLLVALALFTVAEPLRRGYMGAGEHPQGFDRALAFIRSRFGTFGPLMIGNSAVTIIGYSFFWLPSMFARTYALEPATAGIWYGLVLATTGPAGVIAGARLSAKLYERGRPNAPFLVFLAGLGLGVPFAVMTPLMPTAVTSIAALCPSMFGLAMASATSTASVIHVAPAQFRSQVSALHLLVISLAGLFLGPTSVAVLTDHVYGGPETIRWSMATVSAAIGAMGLFALAAGRAGYRRLAEDAESWYGR